MIAISVGDVAPGDALAGVGLDPVDPAVIVGQQPPDRQEGDDRCG
ncbi:MULTISPECIES: hypothetical protein [unclassified Mesorhizobium]|nr:MULTISPECIES: hypothetical protein [unclassified Mesorhizobium]